MYHVEFNQSNSQPAEICHDVVLCILHKKHMLKKTCVIVP